MGYEIFMVFKEMTIDVQYEFMLACQDGNQDRTVLT